MSIFISDDSRAADNRSEASRVLSLLASGHLGYIRKSFLSGLIGIAVSEHRIELSKTLSELGFNDIAPSLTEIEKSAKVGDLLKARSGVYHLASNDTPGMTALRPARGSHLPGTYWCYNNWDFNALGAISEQQTQSSIFQEL